MQRTSSDALQRMLQSAGWIYLIREREFIKTHEQVYKLGKTGQDALKRAAQYPNDSIIEIHLRVVDHHVVERELLKTFKARPDFKWRRDLGSEYFEGSRNEMIKEIIKYADVVDDCEEQDAQIQDRKILESSARVSLYSGMSAADGDVQMRDSASIPPPQPAYVDILIPAGIPYAQCAYAGGVQNDNSPHIMINNAFGEIYSLVTEIISHHFHDNTLGCLHRDHRLHWISETFGNPLITGEEVKNVGVPEPINLDKFIGDLEKLFGKPTSRAHVTCEQYTRFVAINNIFVKLARSVRTYNELRQKISSPQQFIGVKLAKKVCAIVRPIYCATLKKCSDYMHVGGYYESIAQL